MSFNGSAILDRPTTTPALPSTESGHEIFVDVIGVEEIFVDRSYQRELDTSRAKRMARDWDRRLVGVIDVSDRGEGHPGGRYAVINGQHRVAAARQREEFAVMAANIHVGLSVADEAWLFHQIDVKTRRLTTWDRWKSRRAAGDPIVIDIEAAAAEAGYAIAETAANGHLRCVSTCEKVYRAGGKAGGKVLLTSTLTLIHSVWGPQVDAVEAAFVGGVALVLRRYTSDLDHDRFSDTLVDYAPRQIKARAEAMKDTDPGLATTRTALVLVDFYNRSKGPKLDRAVLRPGRP